ncbi:hypothetical protein LCGC14_2149160, partial [marine sediment metagenome]
MTIRNRFEAKYVKVSSGCWEWIAGKDKVNYGRFWVNGTVLRAHRIAWVLTNGPIPTGMLVLHR